jgi:protein TonB
LTSAHEVSAGLDGASPARLPASGGAWRFAWIAWFAGHLAIASALLHGDSSQPLARALGEYLVLLGLAAVPVGMVWIANRLRQYKCAWHNYLLALVMLGSALTAVNAWLNVRTAETLKELEAQRAEWALERETKARTVTPPATGMDTARGSAPRQEPAQPPPAVARPQPAPKPPAPKVAASTAPSANSVAPVVPEPLVERPPAPAPPVARTARVMCPNYVEVMQSITYPREALRDNLEGAVVVEFTVTASGEVRDAVIRSSTDPVFNRASIAVVSRLNCVAQGQDVRVQAPISFSLR